MLPPTLPTNDPEPTEKAEAQRTADRVPRRIENPRRRGYRDLAMSRFLDPRSDIVFKRIFGEHPEILREFLTNLPPFEEDRELITELEYLPAEQVPEIPLFKNTIVDVRCRDGRGRQFIVEMQLAFTSAFLQRVLFNASKAYVRQLDKGERYESLCPVYGLSLLDAVFDHETDNFYHDYRLVEAGQPQRVPDGLRLVFVELPKYRETSPREARQVRWAWRQSGNGATATGGWRPRPSWHPRRRRRRPGLMLTRRKPIWVMGAVANAVVEFSQRFARM